MLHTFWSVKGGSGVTVVAAGLASVLARRGARTVLVDLGGDLPAALGLAEPDGAGVHDWLASDGSGPGALEHLRVDVATGLTLLPAGRATDWSPGRATDLAHALVGLADQVVVDAGTPRLGGGAPDPRAGLAAACAARGRSLLVLRACYLALRRYHHERDRLPAGLEPDGLVVVTEDERALGPTDVARAVGLPVLASLPRDPVVARAVDAGILAGGRLRSVTAALGAVS